MGKSRHVVYTTKQSRTMLNTRFSNAYTGKHSELVAQLGRPPECGQHYDCRAPKRGKLGESEEIHIKGSTFKKSRPGNGM